MATKLPLTELLGSISVDNAGTDTFNIIFKHHNISTLEELFELSEKDIAESGSNQKKTIGPKNALKIYYSLRSIRIQSILSNFSTWLKEESNEPAPELKSSVDIKGKNVCFTGTAPIPRNDLKNLLTKLGANVQSSVSSTTHILFIEDENSTSSKAKSARDKGIQILNYTALGI